MQGRAELHTVGQATLRTVGGSVRRAISFAHTPDAAADELFGALWQPGCCLVVLFVSPDRDLAALGPALRHKFGDIPLAGCTTSGEIGPGGYAQHAITGFSLAAPDFAASLALIEGLDHAKAAQMHEAVRGARLAIHDAAPWARHDHLFAMTLIDGMCGCEELVASAACGALAGIPLRGGSAGDAQKFVRTFVLHQHRFVTNAALVLVVATRRPFRAFKTEHFSPGQERLVVTAADPARRIVTELNAEPAGAEYARVTGLRVDQLTPAAFATHPMMVRVGEHCFVRSIRRLNQDLGLTFLCAIDEGAVLTVGAGGDLAGNLRASFADIEAAIGPPALVIAFDCMLRGMELDQRGIRGQVGGIMDAQSAVGFSTYGEQYDAMHVNQTLSGIAIGGTHG